MSKPKLKRLLVRYFPPGTFSMPIFCSKASQGIILEAEVDNELISRSVDLLTLDAE